MFQAYIINNKERFLKGDEKEELDEMEEKEVVDVKEI